MAHYPVLVIDDDIWMQRILSKILQGFGFTTYVASNGFDGVALALEHKPIVIVMDVLMPELSGHLTLRLLKTIKATKDIPVLMVTAVSDKENLGLAFKSGAEGFIRKPFTWSTIFDKLRDVLGAELLAEVGDRMHVKEASATVSTPPAVTPKEEKPAANGTPAERESPETEVHAPVAPEHVSRSYKSEDKRNLDAVKQMLLKKK